MKEYDLTHARHDPAHCMVPGLFRPLKRGERKNAKLDIIYHFGKNETLEFTGPEPLGADDMRVLQGLVAMAGPSNILLQPEPKTDAGKHLRFSLKTKWEAIHEDAIVVRDSFYKLMKEIGYQTNNGKKLKQIRASIERLWKVSIIVSKGKRRRGFQLLSEYASNESKGQLFVALNPKITNAILGGPGIGVAHIYLDEIRELKSDPARILHQYLSAWVGLGKKQRCSLDKLIRHIWPGEHSTNTVRQHRLKTCKALTEISFLKRWTINQERRRLYLIQRQHNSFFVPVESS